MKTAKNPAIGFCCLLLLLCSPASAAEPWRQALAQMPLASPVTRLDRSNCVDLVLRSFRSNSVVKAVVFMPGALDEMYLVKGIHAELGARSASLLDAVEALENQTPIRCAFRPPLLLLHTAGERLEPLIRIQQPQIADALRRARFIPRALFTDLDWDSAQPLLSRTLDVEVAPWPGSPDSWHFYRMAFAAWNLTGWEALRVVALSTQTRCTLRRQWLLFIPHSQLLFETARPGP